MVKLLFILASFQALAALLVLFFLYPQLNAFYVSLETETSAQTSLIPISILLVFSATEYAYAFILKKQTKISQKQENIAVLLLIISFVSTGYLVASTIIHLIAPIYEISSQIK